MKKIIRKKGSCPKILDKKSLKSELVDITKYYYLPENERRLSRPPINNEKIYSQEVLAALNDTFSNRCAWCETLLLHEKGNVEHFRPKSNASGENEKSSVDHYGWLVYEWENLFLSCKQCNSAKMNKFPVGSLRAKPLSTWAEANIFEDVLLLNPCKDDPLKHISISYDGTLYPLTEKGEYTISIFNLNRTELIRRRENIVLMLLNLMSNKENITDFLKFSINEENEQGTIYLFISLFLSIQGKVVSTSAVEKLIQSCTKNNEFPSHIEKLRKENRLNLFWENNTFSKICNERHYETIKFGDFFHDSSSTLSRVLIENFKGLESIELNFSTDKHHNLGPCTMLLGENSTGKSSILQAIALAIMKKSQRKNLGLDFSEFLTKDSGTWSNSDWNEAKIILFFSDDTTLDFRIDKNFNDNGNGVNNIILLAYGARRNIRKLASTKTRRPSNRTLFSPTAFIPNPSAWLRECSQSQFESISRAMKEILALKQDDHLHRDENGLIMVYSHKRLVPIEKMSDGYKTIFYVALDIMRHMIERWDNLEYAYGIVLIDEIETHLHPRWKLQVVSAFRKAMPNVQFIITTHDPLCLRGMFNGEVHVLHRNNNNEIIEEKNLPNFQALRTEQILTSDYFGLLTSNDPEIERKIEEVSSNEYISSENRSQYIKHIKQELSQMSVLGETLSQRVVHEALVIYLNSAKNRTLNVQDAKENAITEILNLLQKKGINSD
ncbi:AAA family ATPase [Providencia rettgeri]|nr:AAA family ATPase [Providencia rettgeri]